MTPVTDVGVVTVIVAGLFSAVAALITTVVLVGVRPVAESHVRVTDDDGFVASNANRLVVAARMLPVPINSPSNATSIILQS